VFGRIADPLADKVVITGVLVLGMSIPETQLLVPSWIVLLVLAREFVVSGLRAYLEGQGAVFAALWAGKTKLVVQAVYCGAILFYPGHRFTWVWWLAQVFMWSTAAITVYSAFSYVAKASRMLARGADI
jgi:CDP-diacylglycerol--glycerol-3-phosphate 3-phosphatidyltransferase